MTVLQAGGRLASPHGARRGLVRPSYAPTPASPECRGVRSQRGRAPSRGGQVAPSSSATSQCVSGARDPRGSNPAPSRRRSRRCRSGWRCSRSIHSASWSSRSSDDRSTSGRLMRPSPPPSSDGRSCRAQPCSSARLLARSLNDVVPASRLSGSASSPSPEASTSSRRSSSGTPMRRPHTGSRLPIGPPPQPARSGGRSWSWRSRSRVDPRRVWSVALRWPRLSRTCSVARDRRARGVAHPPACRPVAAGGHRILGRALMALFALVPLALTRPAARAPVPAGAALTGLGFLGVAAGTVLIPLVLEQLVTSVQALQADLCGAGRGMARGRAREHAHEPPVDHRCCWRRRRGRARPHGGVVVTGGNAVGERHVAVALEGDSIEALVVESPRATDGSVCSASVARQACVRVTW